MGTKWLIKINNQHKSNRYFDSWRLFLCTILSSKRTRYVAQRLLIVLLRTSIKNSATIVTPQPSFRSEDIYTIKQGITTPDVTQPLTVPSSLNETLVSTSLILYTTILIKSMETLTEFIPKISSKFCMIFQYKIQYIVFCR